MDSSQKQDAEESFYVSYNPFDVARYTLKENGLFGTLAKYIAYKIAIKQFLAEPEANKKDREYVYKRFAIIDKKVKCGHYPYQFLLMAKYILDLNVPGPLVECGSYKGGGSAKLSILAKMTGRKLYICDSFEGLPNPKFESEAKQHGIVYDYNTTFHKGEFTGSLEEVKSNITKYGCIEVCEFVKGFFDKSLPGLNIAPAFVFTDVDYFSSARDCLKNLWPRMEKNGLWFTHEATYHEYIYGILDSTWWRENMNECPPLIIGAGTGLSHLAQAIAYMQKI